MLQNYWATAGRHLRISLLLVVLAIILALVFRTSPRWIKLAAMIISWLADMMLARYAPFTRLAGGYSFTKGALMFMFAHLLYLFAFILLIRMSGPLAVNAGFWLGCAVLAGVLLLLIAVYFRNPTRDPRMLLIGIIYGLVIGTLGIAVFTYAVQTKGLAWLTLIGIVSFMFSDLLIGLEKVGGISIANQDDLIWIFYPIGQLLIIL